MKKGTVISVVVGIILLLVVIFVFIDQRRGGTLTDTLVNLFPRGTEDATPSDDTQIDDDTNIFIPDIGTGDFPDTLPKLRKVTERLVVGFIPVTRSGQPYVRFVEEGTGHVFDQSPLDIDEEIQMSNRTILRVKEVIFGNGGNDFIVRYFTDEAAQNLVNFSASFNVTNDAFAFSRTFKLGDIHSEIIILQEFLNENLQTPVSISGAGSLGNETRKLGGKTRDALKRYQDINDLTVTGIFDTQTKDLINQILLVEMEAQTSVVTQTDITFRELPNFDSITLSPTKNRMLYFVTNGNSANTIVASLKNVFIENLYTSLFTDWIGQWPSENLIVFTTKPSQDVEGNLYFLDQNNGALVRILSDIKGLTALVNPSGEKILYSEKNPQGNGFLTFNYSSITDTKRVLRLQTLPEKCVWSKKKIELVYCGAPSETPQALYPDSWYQGTISFNDNIWRINTNTGEEDLLVTPIRDAITTIDVIHPDLDLNEDFLYFIDKEDSSLWVLDLN